MAKATQSRATDKAADAIALLKQDHRTVEALFEEFEKAEDDQLGAIAQRVCQLLTVHAQIEEEILYPATKDAFEGEQEEDLVNEAAVEHASAKELIAKIEDMSQDDELFKASVKVLGEYIKHHVKEEEGELFPELKKTEVDLKTMGSQLQERKLELMEELGIDEDEPERKPSRGSRAAAGASKRPASTRSGGRSSRQ
jgi:hemerythrin superfamily protein